MVAAGVEPVAEPEVTAAVSAGNSSFTIFPTVLIQGLLVCLDIGRRRSLPTNKIMLYDSDALFPAPESQESHDVSDAVDLRTFRCPPRRLRRRSSLFFEV